MTSFETVDARRFDDSKLSNRKRDTLYIYYGNKSRYKTVTSRLDLPQFFFHGLLPFYPLHTRSNRIETTWLIKKKPFEQQKIHLHAINNVHLRKTLSTQRTGLLSINYHLAFQ